jgi:chromosome segregation ATPase
LGLAVALAAAPALAQNRAEPIRAALADVHDSEAKARPLIKRMEELVTKNAEKKKAYDTVTAERKALDPRLRHYNAELTKYDAALTAYSKQVDTYNAKCSGKVSQDQYRRCLKQKGDLAGRKIELDSAKTQLETERRAIEAAFKAKDDRLAAIAKEMAANLAAWEKAEKQYAAIYARIEALRKRLIPLCASGQKASDPFAVRLCVGAGWDAKKQDLTALTDLPPPAK